MKQDDAVAELERIGFTAYEAQAYAALVEYDSVPATVLATECSVPRSRIYDVVSSLEADGHVETFSHNGKRHARATDPTEVLEQLRRTGQTLAETADHIEDEWQRSEFHERNLTLLDSGVAGAMDQILADVREAGYLVEVICTDTEYFQLRSALGEARDGGAVVRVTLEQRTGLGEVRSQPVSELRTHRVPSPFLVIVDRRSVWMAPNRENADDYVLTLSSQSIAYIFHWFFLAGRWAGSEPLFVADYTDLTTYVDIIEFIRDVEPLTRSGVPIPVVVEGNDIETGANRRVTGTVASITYPSQSSRTGERPTYTDLAGVKTVSVETGDGRVHIGGRGATEEDLEIRRIAVALPVEAFLDLLARSGAL
ncbi:TrmB family transcriptional regulator sugar-binding domain-containing protein [Haloarcula marina]|uniref:TrmB family transcriptional regulator sugar-binding domain-containing protein n=1 Tax=Haloarcula marina TaxID=2961574 RepID=UPI0020B69C3D|nr:TrmB family transcriptional regulator sugar-binding domain-containing protein [Halomicroarcula marina]